MRSALEEMERRRRKQQEYNRRYDITPQSVIHRVQEAIEVDYETDSDKAAAAAAADEVDFAALIAKGTRACDRAIRKWEKEMAKAARQLDFERAAALRDRIRRLQHEIILA